MIKAQKSKSLHYVTIIIRPHHSTMHVAAANCYRPSSVVCRSVCHLVSPAKTDKAIEMPFALRTRVGPIGKDILHLHIADRFMAKTVLCSFNTIQPSSYMVATDFQKHDFDHNFEKWKTDFQNSFIDRFQAKYYKLYITKISVLPEVRYYSLHCLSYARKYVHYLMQIRRLFSIGIS